MVKDFKTLYETACGIGETHAQQVIKHANEIHSLRQILWRTLIHLRAGRIDQARRTLERQIEKDQSKDH